MDRSDWQEFRIRRFPPQALAGCALGRNRTKRNIVPPPGALKDRARTGTSSITRSTTQSGALGRNRSCDTQFRKMATAVSCNRFCAPVAFLCLRIPILLRIRPDFRTPGRGIFAGGARCFSHRSHEADC
jgi:hypothetical protein